MDSSHLTGDIVLGMTPVSESERFKCVLSYTFFQLIISMLIDVTVVHKLFSVWNQQKNRWSNEQMILFLHMQEQTQTRLGRVLLSDQNICSVCTSQSTIPIQQIFFIFEYDASKAGVCMLLWELLLKLPQIDFAKYRVTFLKKFVIILGKRKKLHELYRPKST